MSSSTGKILLLGLVAGGAALVLLGNKNANASGLGGSVPKGWNPPAGATVTVFPANGPGTIAIKAAGWQAEAGQPAGRFLLVWDPNHSESFVALFFPAATPNGPPAILAAGTDTNTQLILSSIPSILGNLTQAGAA